MKENDPASLRSRYILALMLERKKLLRQVDRQRSEEILTILVYEHLPTGEVWLIEDPGLKLNELTSVQSEVAALLGAAEVREGSEAVFLPSPVGG
jgi:hypothetical protein